MRNLKLISDQKLIQLAEMSGHGVSDFLDIFKEVLRRYKQLKSELPFKNN